MIKQELLKSFPTKRLQPVDGMAVTAKVWEEAHDYHRQQLRFHSLFSHGPGIVAGLDVIASDPPDNSVYILPGVAIDQHGQTIFLTEALAFDVGRMVEGQLYLLLNYGESSPRADDGRDQELSVLRVHSQFGIEARPALPDAPYVELARLWREGRTSPILDAKNQAHPGPNEIDQRFRRYVGATPRQVVSIGVAYAGTTDRNHGKGADHLGRAVSQSPGGAYRVAVDDNVTLGPGLEAYALLFLVGQQSFDLSPAEKDALFAYLQAGGTVFMESCRRKIADADAASAAPADASLQDLASASGVRLEEVGGGHDLLVDPHLFAAAPPGFESKGSPGLKAGGGVVFSSHDYGCLWNGDRRGAAPSREQIRAAQEWGSNLIAYALARRNKARSSPPGA